MADLLEDVHYYYTCRYRGPLVDGSSSFQLYQCDMPACACYFTQKVNMRNFRSEERIKRNILNVLRNISFI